ncbi:MAG: hypothetical protein OFPII_09890 [Osedax symbiont Rs1]|nr:MAG: hypothetical protein OFPII_09890 [Osedax symbiont Rs1]
MTLLIFSSASYAETSETVTSVVIEQPIMLPVTLTRESVAVLLSDLSDKEVRTMLNKQLNGLADKQQNEQVTSDAVTLKEGIKRLKSSFKRTAELTSNMANTLRNIAANFRQDRVGYAYLVNFFTKLSICLGIAFILDFLLAAFLRKKFDITLDNKLPSLKNKLHALAKLLFVRLLNLLLFYVVAATLIEELILNDIEEITAEAILDYIFIAKLAFLIAALLLSPKDKTLRLYKLKCPKAEILTNRLIIISLIAASDIFLDWSRDLGLGFGPGSSRIGFWFNLLFYCSIIWLVWRSRHIFEEMLLNGRDRVSQSQLWFIRTWPKMVIIISVLVWLSLEYVLANFGLKEDYIDAAAFTLVFINFLPFLNMGVLAAVEYFLPVNDQLSERQISFQYEIQDKVNHALQLLLASVSLFGLSILWGVDYSSLSEQGTAEYILAIFIELVSVPVLAYVVWLFLDIYIAYKLTAENPDVEEEESEGGVGLSRMATVLPILRVSAAFVIVVFAMFGVFASLGVNTTPLLAGASVIGLAIGFGAQTLVKDIVSGLFFLVDDAFRMGEYVDVGGIKGTVERIALRSLRLRHHLGAQHTIPYGEISTLTNFSRDWVIMKLRFRVPHDTDVNKIKKLFKKLGKELLQHPELGKDFIAPFKSQGVLEVDEIGMLIRGKFTAKPGGQFMIRKEIYVRVQQLFAENNIEFAKRRVEVQIPDSVPKELHAAVAAAASEVILDKAPVKPA